MKAFVKREASAMHAQRVTLFFNVGHSDAANIGRAVHNMLFHFDHFSRGIWAGSVFVEVREKIGSNRRERTSWRIVSEILSLCGLCGLSDLCVNSEVFA
jgi:hypothetical protein